VLSAMIAQNVMYIVGAMIPAASPSLVYAAPANPDSAAIFTGCLGTWTGTLPHVRPIARVDQIVAGGQTAPQGSVWAGEYDPVNDRISIIKGCASDLTLAHEYGHALLLDVIREKVGPGAPALGLFSQLDRCDQRTSPDEVPEWLQAEFREYRRVSATTYGDPYYVESFNEYFAESFAWTANRSGMGVPPTITAYFESVEAGD
jgi:hypothetical protein